VAAGRFKTFIAIASTDPVKPTVKMTVVTKATAPRR
jgi:hypothetical protein